MTIRITLVKDDFIGWTEKLVPARTQVTEFEDAADASNWFTEDSYFDEKYTRLALWERIP